MSDFIVGPTEQESFDTSRNSVLDAERVVDAENPRGFFADAWFDLRRTWQFWMSAIIIAFILAISAFPSLFANRSLTSSLTGGCDLADSLLPPSSQHWFGTDQLGCDVYALTIFGARPSVVVAIAATGATVALGALIGLVAGYYGGWIDAVLSRLTDVVFGLPVLLGGIVILTGLGMPGLWGVVLVLVIFGWVATARMIRSTTIEIKGQQFVLAARALGASDARVITRHVLPNAMGPAIVVAVISLGGFVGAEAIFSFLGLGIQPPEFSWGSLIGDAQTVFFTAPWTLFFPGLFLSITVLGFIVLGDVLHDALDPKRRKRS